MRKRQSAVVVSTCAKRREQTQTTPPCRRRNDSGTVHRLLMAVLRWTYRVEHNAHEHAMGSNLVLAGKRQPQSR